MSGMSPRSLEHLTNGKKSILTPHIGAPGDGIPVDQEVGRQQVGVSEEFHDVNALKDNQFK